MKFLVDMPLSPFLAEWLKLILFRGGNYNEKEMLKLLKRVLKAVPEQELPNSVIVVDKIRIRRRRLPFGLID